MSGNLIVSLCFLLLAALCIVGGVLIISRIKYKPGAATEISIPFLGTIKSDYPAITVIFLGTVFAWFGYDLSRTDKVRFVDISGKINIDRAALGDISAIVVGITTSPWTLTGTPDRNSGTMEINIPVPDNWSNYTAYAFAHGSTSVRPVVEGVRLDDKHFELDLQK